MPAVEDTDLKKRKLEIGALIVQRRKALNLSRMKLAVDLKCTLSAVQFWEKGKYFPSEPLREALAKRLGVEQKELAA